MKNYYTTQHIIDTIEGYAETAIIETSDGYEYTDADDALVEIMFAEMDGINHPSRGIDGEELNGGQIKTPPG